MPKKKQNSSPWKFGKFHLIFFLLIPLLLVIVGVSLHLKNDTSLAQTIPQPMGQTGTWNLVYSDEFISPTLDTSKWVTCYPWSGVDNGCAHSQELQWYLPANVSIGSGAAILTAKKETVQGSDQKTYNYTSGMITTGRNKWDTTPAKYAFTYGYIEVRAKVPSGQGLWSALWLLPFSDADPGKWPPEIDIMEVLGNDPSTVHMHFHYLNQSGTHVDSGGSYQGTNFSNDFHTYAVSWEPNAIRWYIDGVERRTAFTDTSRIPSEPMYFIANLAVGGEWPGAPDATTVFPSNFIIDYVRIWKKQVTPTATITPTAIPSPTHPTATPTVRPTVTPTPIDTIAPQVSITSPLTNSTVPRSTIIPITASASDASGVTRVVFYVNSSLMCTDTTAPFSCNWNVPNKRNTSYTLTARAYDPRGNMGSSSQVIVRTR